MLISPYICPPVLLVYNQSYSRRVKKYCISSDVHPLGHSPKLHCIDSMKELIACLKTVHANIHIYHAQKLFSYKKISTLEFVPFLNSLLEGGGKFLKDLVLIVKSSWVRYEGLLTFYPAPNTSFHTFKFPQLLQFHIS